MRFYIFSQNILVKYSNFTICMKSYANLEDYVPKLNLVIKKLTIRKISIIYMLDLTQNINTMVINKWKLLKGTNIGDKERS